MPVPIGYVTPIRFVPLIIAIFIPFYFTGIANMQIVKTGKIRKSFIDMFRLGILRLNKLFLPYFFTFLALTGTLRFLGNLGLFWVETGWLLFFPIVLILSFMYRLHLSKVV